MHMCFPRIQKKKLSITPIQDEGGRGLGQKSPLPPPPPSTSFFPITSTNVGISPKNFLAFSFNPLTHWCKISSLYLVPVRNY